MSGFAPGCRVKAGKKLGTVRHDHDGPCDFEGCRHKLCVEIDVDGGFTPMNFDRSQLQEVES